MLATARLLPTALFQRATVVSRNPRHAFVISALILARNNRISSLSEALISSWQVIRNPDRKQSEQTRPRHGPPLWTVIEPVTGLSV